MELNASFLVVALIIIVWFFFFFFFWGGGGVEIQGGFLNVWGKKLKK